VQNAFAADRATRAIDPAFPVTDDRPFGADFTAGEAAPAPFGIKSDLGIFFMGFGILAPVAPEGAAFEKYGSPYSGAVMDRKTLDIKNNSIV
jgi:hypothetical protein